MTKRFRYDTGCVIDQLENKVLSERQAVNHLNALHEENEQLKQYKQAVNDVLDSYYQRDLTPIEELLLGGIAKELNIDLHYKKR